MITSRWIAARSGRWNLQQVRTPSGIYDGHIQRRPGEPSTSPWDWVITDGAGAVLWRGTSLKLKVGMRDALTALESLLSAPRATSGVTRR